MTYQLNCLAKWTIYITQEKSAPCQIRQRRLPTILVSIQWNTSLQFSAFQRISRTLGIPLVAGDTLKIFEQAGTWRTCPIYPGDSENAAMSGRYGFGVSMYRTDVWQIWMHCEMSVSHRYVRDEIISRDPTDSLYIWFPRKTPTHSTPENRGAFYAVKLSFRRLCKAIFCSVVKVSIIYLS